MAENNTNAVNIVGSEWLYYKIYLGAKSADEILVQFINPITKNLVDNNIISEWFFIRYNDPKGHLRIRFKCTSVNNLGRLISNLFTILNPLVQESIIWKVQIDTYNREVERYGNNTMLLSEKIFYHDSIMVTDFLINTDDDNLRWLFALKAIDSFLDIFRYNLSQKVFLMEHLSVSFRKEFGKSKSLNSNINDKYRLHKNDISNLIEDRDENDIYKFIHKRSDNITSISDEVMHLLKTDSLEIPISSFVTSHIHMTMNRLFKSKNRAHEMVCYEFLFRYYKSKIAVQNKPS